MRFKRFTCVRHWTRRNIDTIFKIKWFNFHHIVLHVLKNRCTRWGGCGELLRIRFVHDSPALYIPVYNMHVIICKPLYVPPENLTLINRQHRI